MPGHKRARICACAHLGRESFAFRVLANWKTDHSQTWSRSAVSCTPAAFAASGDIRVFGPYEIVNGVNEYGAQCEDFGKKGLLSGRRLRLWPVERGEQDLAHPLPRRQPALRRQRFHARVFLGGQLRAHRARPPRSFAARSRGHPPILLRSAGYPPAAAERRLKGKCPCFQRSPLSNRKVPAQHPRRGDVSPLHPMRSIAVFALFGYRPVTR